MSQTARISTYSLGERGRPAVHPLRDSINLNRTEMPQRLAVFGAHMVHLAAIMVDSCAPSQEICLAEDLDSLHMSEESHRLERIDPIIRQAAHFLPQMHAERPSPEFRLVVEAGAVPFHDIPPHAAISIVVAIAVGG